MNKLLWIENIFTKEEHEIIKKTVDNAHFDYGGFTHSNNIIINNYEITDNSYTTNNADHPFWRHDLSYDDFYSLKLKTKIENYVKMKLELQRVYIVCQNYQEVSNFHVDNNREYTYTFCYYIGNKETIDEGYLYIKLPNDDYILCFPNKEKCGLFFPSNYIHKGSSYGIYNNEPRYCITWKFYDDNKQQLNYNGLCHDK